MRQNVQGGLVQFDGYKIALLRKTKGSRPRFVTDPQREHSNQTHLRNHEFRWKYFGESSLEIVPRICYNINRMQIHVELPTRILLPARISTSCTDGRFPRLACFLLFRLQLRDLIFSVDFVALEETRIICCETKEDWVHPAKLMAGGSFGLHDRSFSLVRRFQLRSKTQL